MSTNSPSFPSKWFRENLFNFNADEYYGKSQIYNKIIKVDKVNKSKYKSNN